MLNIRKIRKVVKALGGTSLNPYELKFKKPTYNYKSMWAGDKIINLQTPSENSLDIDWEDTLNGNLDTYTALDTTDTKNKSFADVDNNAVNNSLKGFSLAGNILNSAMKIGQYATTTGKLLNSLYAKELNNFNLDRSLMSDLGGSYSGSYDSLMEADRLSNSKYGINFIKKRKAIKAGNLARINQNNLNNINKLAKDLLNAGANTDLNSLKYSKLIESDYNQGGYALHVKNGAKLEIWEPVIITEIPEEYKSGGKVKESLDAPKIKNTNQKNIIPEGALHKNKHHMENDDNITKKGIPVIDDDGEQLAEIELNEIIFTLEVTEKLEELYNKYKDYEYSQKEKDEVAIEAGKLLVKEILFNTDDRTGLIDTLKNGGIINNVNNKNCG